MLRYLWRRWRVRAAKGARLESVCGGNSTVGSNPTATARGILDLVGHLSNSDPRFTSVIAGLRIGLFVLFQTKFGAQK
jgi:hypothetical protein